MNAALESRAAEVFLAIADLPPSDRDRCLASTPDAPQGLIAWVRTLLAASDSNRDGFLERPAVGTGFSVARSIDPDPIETPLPDSAPACPEMIGPYRVVRTIAENDFTSVYLCHQDAPIRRTAAVKVLHSLLHRRGLLQRFEWERQVFASLQHPNIAQFYDAGATESGAVYFSMEFIEGRNITDFCEQRPLSVQDRSRLFLQVCAAVEHAHQHGVIHRDLKPANILVQTDADGNGRVKVIDFGVAKTLNAEVSPAATLAGQLIGTFAYMSPEQLVGRPEGVDTRTDVFSLGLVLFEMLTDRAARQIATGTIGDAGNNRPTGPAWTGPPLDAALDSALDEDLARIIAKATRHAREARYASVAEFRGDIERFLSNRPIAARPPSIAYRTRKFVRRHRAGVAAGVLLLCAAAATLVVVWHARTQRLDLAVQLAEAWFEETRVMQSTIGEASLRGPALKRLSAQVDAFSQIAPEDPRIRAMQASALTELGYVAIDAHDLDAADRAFAQALHIRTALADDNPRDNNAQMQLSLATVRIGDVAGERGDVAGRLKWSLRAMRIDESLLERIPTNTHALSNLGWSYDRLGNMALQLNDLARAEGYKLRAAEVFDRFARLGPSAEALRGRATARLSLAEIYDLWKRIPEASEQARLAMQDAKAAAELSPADRFVLQVLVYSEFRCAVYSRLAHRPSLTLQTSLDAVDHAELLLSIAPKDPAFQRLLGHALLDAARHASEAGRSELVVPLAERARKATNLSLEYGPADEEHLKMLDEAKHLIEAAQGGSP